MAIQQGMLGLAGVGQNQDDLVAKIRQEQQLRNQQMTQNLGKYAGLAQSGMESAQQFGGALGVEDPRLQRNSKVIEARDAVRAKGIQDPEQQIAELVKELSARGLYEEADRAAQRLKEAQDAKTKEGREERKVAVQEGDLSLRKEQEARQGKLNDAQIAEIRNRISQGSFDIQFAKDKDTGAITAVYRVDKRTGKIEDITDQVIRKETAAAGGNNTPKLTNEEVRAKLRGGGKNVMPANQMPIPGGA